MQKISISTVQNKDINEIAEIEKACFSSPWSKSLLEDATKNENSYFFKAIANGKIVGYSGIYVVLNEGYVYNNAVLKEFRSQGFGAALTNKLLQIAENLHLEFLSLEVRVSNTAAIHLYEKHNFKKVGIRKAFYTNPTEDALIMTHYFC